MASGFFDLSRSRDRSFAVLIAGGLLLFVGCAVRSYRHTGEVSLVSVVNPLSNRYLTVDHVLEQGAKGKLAQSVRLQGEVIQRSPLLNGTVYQIQDRTGAIWVQSDDANLELGQLLTVKGKPVYQEVVLEGLDFGAFYIQEQSRAIANAI